jgi:hypothetical protein
LQINGSTDTTKNLLIGFETDNNYAFIQTLDRGYAWGVYSIALQPAGGNVGIGISNPNTSAILDLTSTSQAFLPPRMTTTQRDNIASATEGMVIYNITTHVLNFHNGTVWGAV